MYVHEWSKSHSVSTQCFLVRLYVSEERTKLPSLAEHLKDVKLLPYSQVISDLQGLIKNYNDKIWISDFSSQAFVQCVPIGQRCSQISPIQLLKGVKNETEITGMKNCHVSLCL